MYLKCAYLKTPSGLVCLDIRGPPHARRISRRVNGVPDDAVEPAAQAAAAEQGWRRKAAGFFQFGQLQRFLSLALLERRAHGVLNHATRGEVT